MSKNSLSNIHLKPNGRYWFLIYIYTSIKYENSRGTIGKICKFKNSTQASHLQNFLQSTLLASVK